ncbi:hypothetical protein HPB52_015430 [Rhipicephalus sanguineus]|uniref:Tc1-like transposase DDE domain-containing protein n=1 Tax=Rhipicephalus sanguineus TaxID=34632 RepID=A0A9D4SWG6_RHISA|nr:hypothetical protein HPB52_015430 [Rhipicephalus sanguineus]
MHLAHFLPRMANPRVLAEIKGWGPGFYSRASKNRFGYHGTAVCEGGRPEARRNRPPLCRGDVLGWTWYDEEYIRHVAASGRSAVSVWGAITRDGLGPLHKIEDSLTANSYVDIIEQVLLPFLLDGPFTDGLFVFQHDRSPIHTAKCVRATLEGLGINVLEWPPKGADVNIIENIWGLMKKKSLARPALEIQSRDTLWIALQEEWERLRADPDLLRNLYASLPGRIQDIVDAEGGFSRH